MQKLRVDSPNKRVYNHENAKADPGPKNSTSPGPPPPFQFPGSATEMKQINKLYKFIYYFHSL